MCEVCGANELSAQKRPYYAVGLMDNLASIRSGWNHITCAPNQENNGNSAFVLPNCEIQKIFTLVLQVFVEKEIHRHIAIKLEKLPRFEEDNQNIEFLSTYSSNLNKETNKCSFWLHLKIVL